jgi:peptidoglycan-N-acetylglucosamine deacetylase
MKAAFTLDDLPLWPQAYPPEGYSAAGIVDSIIEALDHHKIRGVYAFCNSWSLVKHPEFSRILDRWTSAGHYVGNHTHAHPELNDVSADEYIDEIDLADKHLGPWLSKSPSRFFRYTLCYWGNTEEKRERVKSHLAKLGYTAAEVTTWVYEWQWNRAFLNYLDSGDTAGIELLKHSFLDFSAGQLRYDFQSMRAWFGRDVPGVVLGHSVAFFADVVDSFLGRLKDEGLEFISLQEASSDSVYTTVAGFVSDKFLVYHQKLAQAEGRPIPIVAPDNQAVFDEVAGKSIRPTGRTGKYITRT